MSMTVVYRQIQVPTWLMFCIFAVNLNHFTDNISYKLPVKVYEFLQGQQRLFLYNSTVCCKYFMQISKVAIEWNTIPVNRQFI